MVFGLNAGQDSAIDLDAFLSAFQVSFPILLDANSTYWQYRQSGATSPYPLDYVIDQDGRVAYFSTEYRPEDMIAVIDGLLDNPAAQPDVPPAPSVFLQVSPNPFNPQTKISFTLERSQSVSLDIHDTRGRLVCTLLSSEVRPTGPNHLAWDGKDDHGQDLPSGLYMARIRTLNNTAVAKLTLVR